MATKTTSLLSGLSENFSRKELFGNYGFLYSLIFCLIPSILNIFFALSIATLIFSGDLARYLPVGIGITLFSACIIGSILALGSSLRGVIAAPQESSAVILSLMIGSIAGNIASSGSPSQVLPTIVAGITFCAFLTGGFFLALGYFQIGGLIRFVPYPVLGGFIAGTGILIIQGSFTVMANQPLSLNSFSIFFEQNIILLWFPGFVFAIILFFLQRRYNHTMVLPVSLFTGILLFYISLWLSDISISQAQSKGWLLSSSPESSFWPPLSLSSIGEVNWEVLFGETDSILIILAISALSLLLNVSGLEVATKNEIHLDHDLKVTGIANFVAGLGGGLVGYHTISDTLLIRKLGASSRFVGLLTAISCGIILFTGPSLLLYIPKPLIGGLLLFLGFSLLVEWLYDSWFTLPRSDYFLIIVILLVIGSSGFLQGVAVGIVLAVFLFVINYSRVNIIKHELSGVHHTSNVYRPIEHRNLLLEKGDRIYILLLQGYIFFGTAEKLFNNVNRRLSSLEKCTVRFILLDFRLVDKLDSSTAFSFKKMRHLAITKGVTLAFTGLNLKAVQQLQLNGSNSDSDDEKDYRIFSDLDHGMEWCEDKILEMENARSFRALPIEQQLAGLFSNPEMVPRFINFLERVEFPAGQPLFCQGDKAEYLYFIESGKITVLLELGGASNKRLQTMGAGTVVGEIGLYTKTLRTASVIAEQPSVLYKLSLKSFEKMQIDEPQIAGHFHQHIVRLLANRLIQENKTTRILMS